MAQRWEYLSIEIVWDEESGRWTDDHERAGDTLGEVLTPYGGEGWELVGLIGDRWERIPPGDDGEVVTYSAVFKRPVAA